MKGQIIVKAFATAGFLSLAACGNGSNFVEKVQVTSSTVNGSRYMTVITKIDAAQIIVPAAQFQIPNKKNPDLSYGSVQITPNFSGGSDLRLDLNLSALVSDKPLEPLGTLPNGLPLPVGGWSQQTGLSIPISEGTRLYVDLDLQAPRAFLGLSVGVKEFSTSVTGGIFVPFQQENGIRGVAGVFTGPGAYQSGFAIFVDVSQELQKILGAQAPLPMSLASGTSADSSLGTQGKVSSKVSSIFTSAPSAADQNLLKGQNNRNFLPRGYELKTFRRNERDVLRRLQRQIMIQSEVTLQ